MTPTELRQNLSATLDRAAAGEVVTITRAGLIYELKAVFPVPQEPTQVSRQSIHGTKFGTSITQ